MILYIIRWTVIYVLLICLLHKLYLFFQDNLTTTKNKDYYNNVLIEPNSEPNVQEPINEQHINEEPINEEPIISSKDLNNDFTYEMKNELNNFISKIKT
jgi:hypothetical protein